MQPRKRKAEGKLAELTANVTEEMLAKTRREMIDELILAEKQELINKAVEWIDYNNKNGGSLFDNWKEDFRKHMEE